MIRRKIRKIRVLTQEEQAELDKYLLMKCSNLHIGIYISLYTGIRLGELCALRWKKINLEEKMILSIRQ